MTEKKYFVYILSSNNNRVLYVGVTNNIKKRVYEHKTKIMKGFTSKYNVNKLVYFEMYNDIEEAIKREKQIKAGSRRKKEDLINKFNVNWKDLYNEI